MFFPEYPAVPLKYGDSGNDVESMQAAMNVILAKYPTHDVLVEDGYFGNETDIAVRRFQQNVGLPQDGIVGEYTWISIFALANVIYES
ncbi:MAG: peptidoglycan-binding protein [Oscillospiraceae bacterium]|nr:peptidoglycan-binding protein [Oscillospiraceae bacterium]